MFQNSIWKFFTLFNTALMNASYKGDTETVKILVKQEGIDINAQNIKKILSIFIFIILYFKIIIGNSLNYFIQHLFGHLKTVTQK